MSRLGVCFLVVTFTSALQSVPLENNKEIHNKLIYIDAENNERVVNVNAPVDSKENLQKAAETTEFWLYTNANPDTPQILRYNDIFSIINSNIQLRQEIVIIIHGWVSNGNTQPNSIIRKSLFDKKNLNIITVDWRRVAYTEYANAVAGVPEVGRIVGQFLILLNTLFMVSYYNVHIIGFDMGAHIAGLAGRETGGRVARVTALSPSGEMFTDNFNSLAPTDGLYVEAIHTNNVEGGYGTSLPVGYVNVYPNGGSPQPGCLYSLCSHNRAYELFAASIDFNHLEGYLCTPDLPITWSNCRGEALRMGNDDLRKTASPGTYRVETYSAYPY